MLFPSAFLAFLEKLINGVIMAERMSCAIKKATENVDLKRKVNCFFRLVCLTGGKGLYLKIPLTLMEI